nr:cucumisin-like [Tanacetum cinerariifolium]
EDPIAIGAFHSMKNNILVCNSGGNDGPFPGSISNISPWSLSVAASSIDRKFVTQLVLGDNITYQGPSINTFDGAVHPIVYANALLSGASGSVIEGDLENLDSAFSFPIAATYLNSKDGNAVLSYINSTSTPTASILKRALTKSHSTFSSLI